MERYIKADDIKNAIDGVTRNYLSTLSTTDSIDSTTAKWLYKRLKTLVDEMPTADVRENVHAHWVDKALEDFPNITFPVCSNCDNDGIDYVESNFCPYCGAQMVWGGDEDAEIH